MEQLDFNQELSGFSIAGELSSEPVNPGSWKEAPHRVLANLPLLTRTGSPREWGASSLIDPRAAKSFTEKYGVMHLEADRSDTGDSGKQRASGPYCVGADEIQEARALLRQAWDGKLVALKRIQQDAGGQWNSLLRRGRRTFSI